MSGHSKWSTIKHKKGALDAKRGKIFSKLAKEITVAAKLGGGSPAENPRLRLCLLKARASNMPKDNIERAIKKGTGELGGEEIQEIVYEGYAPGGVAIMLFCLTDNKVRTVAEIRNILSKNGGNLGESGSVSWNFHRKGQIFIESEEVSEEKLFELVIEAGAEDVKGLPGDFEVLSDPENFEEVVKALEEGKIPVTSANITMVPENVVKVDELDLAKKIVKVMNFLEDHDDISEVYSNFEFPDSIYQELDD